MTLQISSSHVTLSGLSPNTVYEIQIAAINSAGVGLLSSEVSKRTLSAGEGMY